MKRFMVVTALVLCLIGGMATCTEADGFLC
ncbi:hypothetical protein ABIC59_006026 [Priestia aryabhattai]